MISQAFRDFLKRANTDELGALIDMLRQHPDDRERADATWRELQNRLLYPVPYFGKPRTAKF